MLEKETKGSNRQNVRKQYKQEHSEARSRTCGEEKEHRQTNPVNSLSGHRTAAEPDTRLSSRVERLL